MLNNKILSLFYIYALVFSLIYFNGMMSVNKMPVGDWLWPVTWLFFYSSVELMKVVSGLFVILSAVLVFNPFLFLVKVIHFAFMLICFGFMFSFGKIDHLFHGLVVCSALFIFISPRQNDDDKFIFNTARAYVCLTYFLPGLWKLRFIFPHILNFSWPGWNELLSFNIAMAAWEGKSMAWLGSRLLTFGGWGTLAWLGVLLFEMAGIYPVITYKKFSIYGLFIMIFHLMTYLTTGISFFWTMALVFIVLVLPDLYYAKIKIS